MTDQFALSKSVLKELHRHETLYLGCQPDRLVSTTLLSSSYATAILLKRTTKSADRRGARKRGRAAKTTMNHVFFATDVLLPQKFQTMSIHDLRSMPGRHARYKIVFFECLLNISIVWALRTAVGPGS